MLRLDTQDRSECAEQPKGYTAQTLKPGDDVTEWHQFVALSPQGSLFCNAWWLDAVCTDGYEILTVKRGGRIVAGMPLPFLQEGKARNVKMPKLTHALGVLLLAPEASKYESRLSKEMEIVRALIRALPDFESYSINYHWKFTNWLPFHWAGFNQTTRYAYLIDNLSDLGAVHRGMSDKTRNIIRKAERAGIVVRECNDIEEFLPLLRLTFTRQEEEVPYPSPIVRGVDGACAIRGCRKILMATDSTGRVHAAVYVVFDEKSMFYLMQGTDPTLRCSGAALLAHWHAIQYAAMVTGRYNFGGGMKEKFEHVYRSFGAVQTPYFNIYKQSTKVSLRDVLGSVRQFVRGKSRGWLI
jgi:hypothetical protein